MSVFLAAMLGMALALPSLAVLTPRRWWQRPTLLGTVLLLTCSAAYAQAILHWLAPSATPPLVPVALTTTVTPQFFRVQQALHLRADSATAAPLRTLLPANQIVQATGEQRGDWWQVRHCLSADSSTGVGWVSSLWLRRLDEPHQRDSARPPQLPKCEIRKP